MGVETTLFNASSYRDMLSIDNQVNSHLVSKAEDMSSILDCIKKRGRTNCVLTSSSTPSKKPSATKGAFPSRALPLPTFGETEGLVEKSLT